MKVQIKDLRPNPFRDMKNYLFNHEKLESLSNSIKKTGFWDNILARKADGKIEIAYGHHRLKVLQSLFKPSDIIDIPVKSLTDAQMIKIMANENMVEWHTSVAIIDETVRVTKEFLENHPEELRKISKRAPHPSGEQVGEIIIARFLGWYQKRVRLSLERLGLIEQGELDKKAIESMPTVEAAKKFVKVIKDFKPEPEIQRRAVQKIREKEDYSEEGIESAIIEEQFPTKKPKEIKISELKKLIIEATQSANSLKGKIETLTARMKEFYPEVSYEKEELGKSLEYLGATIQYFIKIYKEQKDATKKGLLKN